MTTPHVIDDIGRDEGCRLTAYQDTLGVWTIGYGHAHVEPGTIWAKQRAVDALISDVHHAINLLDQNIAWWRGLNDARQDVLVNMCFNMGWLSADGKHGLGTFKNTLLQIEAGNYADAAAMMLKSLWAGQVKGRARRLAEQMRTGVRVETAPPTAARPAPIPPPVDRSLTGFLHRLWRRFA